MGSILIHTQDESVTLTAQAVRRLLEKGDGDAALLYLALLRHHGTVQPRSLAGELRWDRLRIEAAEGTLREKLAVLAAICRTSDAIPPVLQAVESAGVPVHHLLRCAPGLLMIVNDSQYETALRSASVSK